MRRLRHWWGDHSFMVVLIWLLILAVVMGNYLAHKEHCQQPQVEQHQTDPRGLQKI